MADALRSTFHNREDFWRAAAETVPSAASGAVQPLSPEALTPLPLTPGSKLEERRTLSYRFLLHYHPFATELTERLVEGGVGALQRTNVEPAPDGSKLPDGTAKPLLYRDIFPAYQPSPLVAAPFPIEELEFRRGSSYGVYNAELFFHIHLAIAVHCTAEGRYALAQRWLHNIFDPTSSGAEPAPQRFWKYRPFRTAQTTMIEDIMVNLASGKDPALRDETLAAVAAWEREPFNPHLVARFRPSAYMLKTVTAYLDNLLSWGDSLFRQDTRESINEATQLYILASLILGPRPQRVPARGRIAPQSYAQLRDSLDAFSNTLRELETDIVFNVMPSAAPSADGSGTAAIASIGQSLYFCIPKDQKLLGYWDLVADRLFKIRNSLNLAGIFRQLPLFEPPIDPALLARAAAAGLDITTVLAGLNQPLPTQRFLPTFQRALELAREVQGLGSALLSAMEKEDSEALQILRAQHDRVVLELGEQTRYAAVQDAAKSREAIERTLASATARWMHYQKLLGEAPSAPPGLDELDMGALSALRLRAEEPELEPGDIIYDIAQGLADDLQGRVLNLQEKAEMDLLAQAQESKAGAGQAALIAGPLGAIPDIGAWAAPLGAGASMTLGGRQLASIAQFASQSLGLIADMMTYKAGRAGRIGGFARREQDWSFQSSQAAHEINTVLRQLRAAQIREAMAERDLEIHRKQIENSKAIEVFLADERKGKVTRKSLYSWMRRETRGLHNRAIELAADVARKAERAFQHEIGNSNDRFIDTRYQSGREGLLAGEQLTFDLRRMEAAFHDQNRRELELVRHVSLHQLDPLALIALRTTGSCTVRIEEEYFDLDAPGQYFRRIKSVAVTVPCVIGPYASVRCRVTLVRSSIRTGPNLLEGKYERDGEADPRFNDHVGSLQSIVTSTGQNDPGVFEPDLRDERYMPFEGSGAISEWRIELPMRFKSFDYDTISDLILHIRYTARTAGGLIQSRSEQAIEARLREGTMPGQMRLLSLRHDFPSQWARFKAHGGDGFAELLVELTRAHYPYWTRERLGEVAAAKLMVRPAHGFASNNLKVASKSNPADDGEIDVLAKDGATGLLSGDLLKASPATDGAAWDPASPFPIYFESNKIEDAWLAIGWRTL